MSKLPGLTDSDLKDDSKDIAACETKCMAMTAPTCFAVYLHKKDHHCHVLTGTTAPTLKAFEAALESSSDEEACLRGGNATFVVAKVQTTRNNIASPYLVVALPAAAPAVAVATCDSRRKINIAIRNIEGGNLGETLDVPTADACEAACCAYAGGKCAGWSWTPIPRSGQCKTACCFLKSGSSAVIKSNTENYLNFTTGCVGFNCSSPTNPPIHPSPSPPPPAPPLPFAYVTPVLKAWYNFATSSGAAGRPFVRDPTTAVFDPLTKSWHVFATALVHNGGGYPGQIKHFSLNESSLAAGPADQKRAWSDEGIVLLPRYNESFFDSSGVFTPGIVRECSSTSSNATGSASSSSSCKWFLFFGGVANQSGAHTEMVGVASADSPWGPFVRYERNPVFSFLDANSKWCKDGGSTPARVDEIKPTVTQDGVKLLAVKSVCVNATALPVIYSPVDQSSWGPPYEISTTVQSPLFLAEQTCEKKGFEEPTLFTAEDGFLHFTGHNHGNCGIDAKYEHFISRNHTLERESWEKAASYGGDFEEPNPIPSAGDGVFGRAILDVWIDFAQGGAGGTGKVHALQQWLTFQNVTWRWTRPA